VVFLLLLYITRFWKNKAEILADSWVWQSSTKTSKMKTKKRSARKKKVSNSGASPLEGHICPSLPQFPYLWKKRNNPFLPQRGLFMKLNCLMLIKHCSTETTNSKQTFGIKYSHRQQYKFRLSCGCWITDSTCSTGTTAFW